MFDCPRLDSLGKWISGDAWKIGSVNAIGFQVHCGSPRCWLLFAIESIRVDSYALRVRLRLFM
jgi:hypothetical protein